MALIERMQTTTQATKWPGKIPLTYVYTTGRGAEVFFKTLKEKGKFVGSRCDDCDRVYVPPRIFCESCFERIEGSLVDLKNWGVVHTFTVCHESYDEEHKDKPTIVAAIQLEGAEGVIFHRIEGVEPEDCYIGMVVEAELKPKNQRKGGILDIKCFKAR